MTATPTSPASEAPGAADPTPSPSGAAPEHSRETGTRPTPAAADTFAAALVERTNAARAARGLPELTLSACARDAALDRAAALVGTGELVHADLAPVNAACSPPSGMTAENLYRGSVTAQEVVDAWLASPGHANNLLSAELTQIGIGCVQDAGVDDLVCAQVFLG